MKKLMITEIFNISSVKAGETVVHFGLSCTVPLKDFPAIYSAITMGEVLCMTPEEVKFKDKIPFEGTTKPTDELVPIEPHDPKVDPVDMQIKMKAKELRNKDPKLTYYGSIQEARKNFGLVKEYHKRDPKPKHSTPNFEFIEPKEDSGTVKKFINTSYYRCVSCGKGQFEKPGVVCKYCKELNRKHNSSAGKPLNKPEDKDDFGEE